MSPFRRTRFRAIDSARTNWTLFFARSRHRYERAHRPRLSIAAALAVVLVIGASCRKQSAQALPPADARSTMAEASLTSSEPSRSHTSMTAEPAWRPAEAGGPLASGELVTVPQVDLRRYMGTWYEIARYPNSYQDGLVGVVVHYELDGGGRIRVRNTGRQGSLHGELTESRASAWVTCERSRSKWAVRFFWPFTADYWIIDLGQDYEYAVVGQPSRKYLWIISRTPTLPPQTMRGIAERLRRQGYDPRRLELTPQAVAPAESARTTTGSISAQSAVFDSASR